jgi:nicotinamidase-related amidase
MGKNSTNQSTALLVMDVQGATVNRLKDVRTYIHSVSGALQKARQNSIPVIYIVIGFRKGYPEVSTNNKSFSAIKNATVDFNTEEALKVYETVAPMPEDIVIIKKRVSAFTGSDLEVVLRSLEIKHLVLSGIATGGVVLSTLREAADKDFAITVLSDCCADSDDEVHRVLITKIFPRQAEVITSEEWCSDDLTSKI